MSQASELLNSLEVPATVASTEEPHIVIGENRFITVPESLKRIAVQHDHNVQTATFDCPRYADDENGERLDMSQLPVYINYMLPNKEKASYIAKNVEADGDIMHFTWTISSNVTQNKGQIAFLVCVKKTGENANGEPIEINHWNSELCTDCYISEGMECSAAIDMEYPDIITELLERMITVESARGEMEEYRNHVMEWVPMVDQWSQEAKTARDEAVGASDYIKDSYAPAIKGNVSGESIRVDDVSPIEHNVKCQVHGKNLFGFTGRVVSNFGGYDKATVRSFLGNAIYLGLSSSNYYDPSNITYTVDEVTGTVTLTGAAWYGVGVDIKVKPNTTYTISGVFSEGVNVGIAQYNADGKYLLGTIFDNATFTTSASTDWIVAIVTPAKTNTSVTVSNIQIEEGSIATAYEPYVDPKGVTVGRCGKNLFDISVIKSQGAITNNGNGSITISVSTSQPVEKFGEICPALKAGDVATLSFNSDNKDQNFIYLVGSKESWHNGTTKTITQAALDGVMYFYAKKDANGNGIATRISDIQVELGETVTGYEPYVEVSEGDIAEAQPATDGTCQLDSVSPTMTIYTDIPGAIVEVEYNRDTTKMFESYVLTDEAKSQIVAEVEDDMAEVLVALNAYAESLVGGAS